MFALRELPSPGEPVLQPLLAAAWGSCYWYSGPPGPWTGPWRVLAAEAGDPPEVVGALAFRPEGERVTIAPWGPAVLPAWRGRGVGRALAAAAGRSPARYVMRFTADRQGTVAARPFLRAYAAWGFRLELRLLLRQFLSPPPPAGPPFPGLTYVPAGGPEAVLPLHEAIFGSSADPLGRMSRQDRRDWLAGIERGGRGHSPPELWQVALVGGEPAGLLILARHSPVRWFVAELGVSPGFRGRGLGAALCERAAGLARAGGAAELTLVVSSLNTPALRLYRRVGYRPLGLLAMADRD